MQAQGNQANLGDDFSLSFSMEEFSSRYNLNNLNTSNRYWSFAVVLTDTSIFFIFKLDLTTAVNLTNVSSYSEPYGSELASIFPNHIGWLFQHNGNYYGPTVRSVHAGVATTVPMALEAGSVFWYAGIGL
jgi:hypothetical protein